MDYELISEKSISINVVAPTIETKIKSWDVSVDKTTVTVGDTFTITVKVTTTEGNTILPIKIEVVSPQVTLSNNVKYDNLGGGEEKTYEFEINTSGWQAGSYSFKVRLYKKKYVVPAV